MADKVDAISGTAAAVMVGAFPPPVYGLSVMNAEVRNRLLSAGANPRVLNIAAPDLRRTMVARLERLLVVIRGWLRLATMSKLSGATLYMSVSGGGGQVYESVFLAIARMRHMRIALHHHSFAYLDKRRALTALLFRLAGTQAIHIANSRDMAVRLRKQYGVRRVAAVSNAGFIKSNASLRPIPRSTLATLGYLSIISVEKGIMDFLDVMTALAKAGMGIRGIVAGLFLDSDTEVLVRERLKRLPLVEYIGPQFGDGKDEFFASIDALVFPTRYVNEAEPLTILDSLSRSVPVIAFGRGTIPEMLGSDCGQVIPVGAEFVSLAMPTIVEWHSNPLAYEAVARGAQERFETARMVATRNWVAVEDTLLGIKPFDEQTFDDGMTV